MSKKVKIFIIIMSSVLGMTVLCFGGFALYIYSLSKELPTIEDIAKFKYAEPMVVYDALGTVIAELGPERRYPISIEKLPEYIGNAVVSVEDARFYEHKGVDLLGIARAFFVNIKAGKVVEGGSTLTQQLVKIIYLTPEKKLKRKLKEAILAYKIDNYLKKKEILELYINQVNFGRGAYGIQAAAINYFGKNADELTLAEAALVAGIPKAPSLYAPHINRERALKRRNHVLFRMYEVGYISEEDYNTACAEEIAIRSSIPLKLRYAGYFMDFVHKYLTEELKIENASERGLKIYTTLRLDFQLEAEKAVRNNLIALSKREGYAGPVGKYKTQQTENLPSVIDNEDETIIGLKEQEFTKQLDTPSYLSSLGFKKAVVKKVNVYQAEIDVNGEKGIINLRDNDWARPAGKGYGTKLKDLRLILSENDIIYVTQDENNKEKFYIAQDPKIEGALVSVNPKTGEIYSMAGGFSYDKSFFNRVTQARRQMGSTFKPIVYATGFENGFVPMDTFLDTPFIGVSGNGQAWKPKNFGGKFSIDEKTLKDALTQSNNTITIKLAEQVGIRKVIQYARQFGFTSDMPADLSVSLGSASATPLEVAYAYCVFCNGGERPSTPYFITKIEDIDGNLLYEFIPPDPVRVLEEASAQMMNDILINIVEHGTGVRAKVLQRVAGGKTGTTNDSKDAWFSGFVPGLVTVSWVGYDDSRKMGGYATGASAAAPAWVDYMKAIIKDIPYELFPVTDKVAYFRVNKETKQITNSFSEDYTFELYPIDENGVPSPIRK